MRRNNKFTAYQRTLFNKYKIDENYLQTGKQRRVCQELLEKIDKKQNFNEQRIMQKVASAFKNTALYKKIISCATVFALIAILQTTPVMADTMTRFQSTLETTIVTETLHQAQKEYSVVIDRDSFISKNMIQNVETMVNTSLHLVNKNRRDKYISDNGIGNINGENTVVVDDDSDIMYLQEASGRVLTVIDKGIKDWQILKNAVKEEVLLLDSTDNPLDKIIIKLKEIQEIDSLNIISHGSSGRLEFINRVLSTSTLEENSEKWKQVKNYLGQDGDIQLFGCNIGQGAAGREFVNKLAELTDADIAASINATGEEDNGGDWQLELVKGEIESDFPLLKKSIRGFSHLLELPAGPVQFDFSGFNDGLYTLTHDYFTVAGYKYNSNWESYYTDIGYWNVNFYAYMYGYGSDKDMKFKVKAEENLFSFELNDIVVDQHTSGHDDLSNLYIIGYKADGSGKVYSGTISGHGIFDSNDIPDWQVFSGVQLDSFAVRWTTGSWGHNPFQFLSFEVDNMAENNTPVLGGNFLTDGAINDKSTIKPFSGVEVSDADGDDVSLRITYTGVNGVLSSPTGGLTGDPGDYNLSSIDAATLTTRLQELVFTPTENQKSPGCAVVTSFTLTPYDGMENGDSDNTTYIAVTSINDAPTITAEEPQMAAISRYDTNNPGEEILSIVGTAISDAEEDDDEALGIAIVDVDNGSGKWQYSSDDGLSWNEVGTVAEDKALLLSLDRFRDFSSHLRFVPQNTATDTGGSITYKAWDRTTGVPETKVDTTTDGGGTAFSTKTDTASIVVEAFADSYIDINFDQSVYGAEGAAEAVTKGDLNILFNQNDGNTSNVEILSVKKVDSPSENSASNLTGGESVVRVFLRITGRPHGLESVEIKPQSNSIYDEAGNAMDTDQTTGVKTLSDKR